MKRSKLCLLFAAMVATLSLGSCDMIQKILGLVDESKAQGELTVYLNAGDLYEPGSPLIEGDTVYALATITGLEGGDRTASGTVKPGDIPGFPMLKFEDTIPCNTMFTVTAWVYDKEGGEILGKSKALELAIEPSEDPKNVKKYDHTLVVRPITTEIPELNATTTSRSVTIPSADIGQVFAYQVCIKAASDYIISVTDNNGITLPANALFVYDNDFTGSKVEEPLFSSQDNFYDFTHSGDTKIYIILFKAPQAYTNLTLSISASSTN